MTNLDMNLRDYFAANAMMCMGNKAGCGDSHISMMAEWAYKIADAMILERNKPHDQP